MAIENVNNALTKFEADDKNLFDQLDTGEKNELKKVTKDDCMKAIHSIESKKIGDKTLKELVDSKSLWYDTRTVSGKTVYDCYVKIDGQKKKIAGGNDLSALIQMYILAKGSNVWTTWIDWWIWEKTIRWWQDSGVFATNEDNNNGNNNPEKNKNNVELLDNIDKILDTNLREYFWKEVDKYTDEYKILNTDTWKLQWSLDRTNKELVVSYDSLYDNRDWLRHKTVRIPFDTFLDINKHVDVNKLVKSIKKEIQSSEILERSQYYEKTLRNPINEYKETTISDLVVRKYFVKYNADFKLDKVYHTNKGYFLTIKNDKDNSWGAQDIAINNILKDNKFDAQKYAWELVKCYKEDAVNDAKTKFQSNTENIKALSNVDIKTTSYKSIISEIDSYWEGYKKDFIKERNEAAKQLNYENMNKYLSDLDKFIRSGLSHDKIVQKLNDVVGIEYKNRRTVVDYNNSFSKHFERVGKKTEYVNKMKEILDFVFGTNNYDEVNK